jgi:hypothetical protein
MAGFRRGALGYHFHIHGRNESERRMQMPRFLSEWSEVSIKAQNPEEQELVAKVEAFARRVQNEAHLYLKFIGD